jgi:DNA-binding NarL/FixJ family response regulator
MASDLAVPSPAATEWAGVMPGLAAPPCCCREERLTPREIDVLCALAAGASTEQAALSLCLSSHTITHHIGDMLCRAGAGNRTELVARAYAAGVLQPGVWPPTRSGRRCLQLSASPAMAC